MTRPPKQDLLIEVPPVAGRSGAGTPGLTVSALLQRPAAARALLLLAHGAGAGMHHVFLEELAARLVARDIACLRYQFPFMEAGRRIPNPAPQLLATVRAAAAEAERLAAGLPLFAGGKSMGGRMTSLAQSEAPLPGVRGLVFFGFPLHRPGEAGTGSLIHYPLPSPGAPLAPPGGVAPPQNTSSIPSSSRLARRRERAHLARSEVVNQAPRRAVHLAHVGRPMLFLQGDRDKLAELPLIESVVGDLGPGATLQRVEGADHGFHVLKRSGRTDEEVLDELADVASGWMLASLSA